MTDSSIFLIDDSVADAELIKLVAQQANFPAEIIHFENGQSALNRLRDVTCQLPTLILLDLNMPGMSGHDVLTEIRQDPRLRRIPVIILTSSEDDTDVGRGYDSNANAYVVKPVRIDGFQVILQAVQSFWLSVAKLPPPPQG